MFGRALLHGKHHAPLYDINRSLFVAALSDAVWTQQDSPESRTENILRMAIVNCNEPASELNVFEGKFLMSFPSE
jgi:hypothetical protein